MRGSVGGWSGARTAECVTHAAFLTSRRGVGQAKEAFRLIEACGSCPRLQCVEIKMYGPGLGENETWEDVTRWETRIKVSLPHLQTMTIPWVFTELDLRGCSSLSNLVISGEWRASRLQGGDLEAGHVMRNVASRVTPPTADGRWRVEGVKGPWRQKPVPDVHWHCANTTCHTSYGCCTVGPPCSIFATRLASCLAPSPHACTMPHLA